jgi:hypothetical protein
MAGVSHIESVRPIVVSILGDTFDDRRRLADIPHTERLLEAAGLRPQAGRQMGKTDRIGAIKEALALFPEKLCPAFGQFLACRLRGVVMLDGLQPALRTKPLP